jgi:cysteine desulfurase family protein
MKNASRIYFDNAATTFPKPPEVLQAMIGYAHIGGSAGRGVYAEARESAAIIAACRQRLNTLFNGQNPNHFIFTLNCTDALNTAIQGLLKPGDHAITTWMDHNSVLRPYNHLGALQGIQYTHVPVDEQSCIVDPADIRAAIRPSTRLIAVVHVSNVTGAVQPIREIGQIAREHDIPFLVDAAQSAGHFPIDIEAEGIDLLAFPGHKGLLGPLGTGALYIRPGLEKQIRPLRFGGTGSASEEDTQPDFMPDRYEAGSHNAIGIAGLSEGVNWILKKGVQAIHEHDQKLCRAFIEGIQGIEGLKYLGPQGTASRIGTFSVLQEGMTPLQLAQELENEYGILTRAGLHCAPLAHSHLGTIDNGGTTRFSFGPFHTLPNIQLATSALARIATSIQIPNPV